MAEDPVLRMKAVWTSPGSQYQTKCYRNSGSGWVYVVTKTGTSWSSGYAVGTYSLGIRHYNPTTGALGALANLGDGS